MNNNPQVAIMMPVYNGEKTLPLAIASLINQTYPYWKCYVVNDGSTDGTKALLDNLKDPRFVVIHFEKNKGRPYARQAALDVAKGKYLAFLDADDFYHPNKLLKQVEILEKNPELALVSCGMGSYDHEFSLKAIRAKGGFLKRSYSINEKLTPARAPSLIRLQYAQKIKYDIKQKLNQDTDFLSRYLHGRKYMVTEEVLYYYSEFVSVTGRKILRTYWFASRNAFNTLKTSPLMSLKAVLNYTFKFAVTAILLPFVGVNYFLERRGSTPLPKELEEFSRVKMLLST